MSKASLTLVSCLCYCLTIASCSQREVAKPLVLTAQEEQALAYLAKDPFMRVVRMRRLNDERIVVTTKQGNKQLYYYLDSNAGDTAKDQIIPISQHRIFKENF